jgi:hypothetical protein
LRGTSWFSQILEDIIRRERGWKKSKRKDCDKTGGTWRLEEDKRKQGQKSITPS